jgi:predicted component of type VI protein secretion system
VKYKLKIAVQIGNGTPKKYSFHMMEGYQTTIGREAEGVKVPHPSVEGMHCILKIENGALVVEDCSNSGTFLNNQRIESRQAETGDILRVGEAVIDLIDVPMGAVADEEAVSFIDVKLSPIGEVATSPVQQRIVGLKKKP